MGYREVRARDMARIARFAIVIVSFAALGRAVRADGGSQVVDEVYKDGCGPISCLVALRALGVASPLTEVAARCDWQEGEPVQFSKMEATLNSYSGIDCVSAKLKPSELVDLLHDRQTVVILAIAKNSNTINHAICSLDVTENDEIVLLDYPELIQVKSMSELVSNWDGASLIVRTGVLSRTIDNLLLYVAPCFAIVLVCMAFRLKRPAV